MIFAAKINTACAKLLHMQKKIKLLNQSGISVDVFHIRLLESQDTGVIVPCPVLVQIKILHPAGYEPSLPLRRMHSEKDIVVMTVMADAVGGIPLRARAVPHHRLIFQEYS